MLLSIIDLYGKITNKIFRNGIDKKAAREYNPTKPSK